MSMLISQCVAGRFLWSRPVPQSRSPAVAFNAEGASEEANEQLFKKILEVWKDIPSSVGMYQIPFSLR